MPLLKYYLTIHTDISFPALRSYLPPTSTCVYFHCESLRTRSMFSLLFLVRFYGCVTAPLTGPACILQRFLWTNIILTHCRVYGKPSNDESLLNLHVDKVQLLKQVPLLPVTRVTGQPGRTGRAFNGQPGQPGERGHTGRPGRRGHAGLRGSPGVCLTSGCAQDNGGTSGNPQPAQRRQRSRP